jgi:hypothetical protein
VVLLSRYLGMEGSAGGNFDLYRVIQAYLLDPTMRATINELVDGWRPGMESGTRPAVAKAVH